jgi:carboxypeptidase C (cathepsin A)
MLIAQEKRQTNIAEYIIYMFQVEDILRALELDEVKINQYINQTFKSYPKEIESILNWYIGLNDLMIEEKIKEKGHLSILVNNIRELEDFHLKLLRNPEYNTYNEQYKIAQQFIKEFSQRSNSINDSEIMICMNAIYSKLLLKLKNVEISNETEQAFSAISSLLSLLSVYFKDYESGKIEL